MGYRVVTVKRRLTKFVLFLLLGAIVNVAVAWGCALWSRVGNEQRIEPLPASVTRWFIAYSPVDVELPQDTDVRVRQGIGVKLRHMSDWIEEPVTRKVTHRVISWRATAGFPLLCLDGTRWDYTDHADHAIWQVGYTSALALPQRIGPIQVINIHYGGVLPFRPLWPGFALNTLFYAAILWLLTLGPFIARRMIRRKRRRCIKCGYDLRGTSGGVCPECGTPTT